MTRSIDVMELVRATIARSGPLLLSQQLRSVLEMAAAAGELPEGAQLPSVRRLAAALHLAPNTVVRAYKQLEAEGIVRVFPRRAYYIVGAPKTFGSPADVHVQGLIDEALRAAERAGLDTIQFLQLVSLQVKARRKPRYRIAVVGDRDAALERRVELVRRSLPGLAVDVIGLSFEELGTTSGSSKATGVDAYLVPMLDIDRAAVLLGPHAHRIFPMYLTLTPAVRSFIASAKADMRFGIVVSQDAFRARMATTVRRIHAPDARVSTASVENSAAVRRLAKEADVLLVGSPAMPRLPKDLETGKPLMELLFEPDDETLHRLRAIVTSELPHAARGRVRSASDC